MAGRGGVLARCSNWLPAALLIAHDNVISRILAEDAPACAARRPRAPPCAAWQFHVLRRARRLRCAGGRRRRGRRLRVLPVCAARRRVVAAATSRHRPGPHPARAAVKDHDPERLRGRRRHGGSTCFLASRRRPRPGAGGPGSPRAGRPGGRSAALLGCPSAQRAGIFNLELPDQNVIRYGCGSPGGRPGAGHRRRRRPGAHRCGRPSTGAWTALVGDALPGGHR